MYTFDFSGKVVVMTGAAGGLGKSAAEAYLEHGAKVAAIDVNEAGLLAFREEAGENLLPLVCDLRDEESVNQAIKKVFDTWGRVDILVNAAGIAVGIYCGTPMEEWDRVLDINLRAQWLTIRAVLPYMLEQKYGKILNFSSVNAVHAKKYLPLHPYCASKEGVLGLTRSVAAYYARQGINCNAIMPGLFMTNMTRDTWSEEQKQRYYSKSPSERPGEIGELNGAILFLTSDMAKFVNGTALAVDGGVTAV